MTVNSRVYSGKEDDQLIREFLSRQYVAGQHPYFSLDPPNWERLIAAARTGSSSRTVQLWEICGERQRSIVGMLVLHRRRSEFSMLVERQTQWIEKGMIDWVEEEQRLAEAEISEKKPLQCTVCERAEGQKAYLTLRGYIKGKPGTIFRRRALEGKISPAALPPRYVLLQVRDLSDEQLWARAEAEKDVFGDSVTAAFLRELQKAPIYWPELDLVIVTPNGRIAAFCTIWLDESNRAGYFEPLATMPAHRRLGLGQALMIEGFVRLQKMGAAMVYLGNDAGNEAGNRLYDSVGMDVFDQEYVWQKWVTP